MVNFRFPLGMKVRDKITGYEGIIVSRSEWLTGCLTYGVKSQSLQEGKPIDSQWFDEVNLEEVAVGIAFDQKQTKKDPGGPIIPVPHPNR